MTHTWPPTRFASKTTGTRAYAYAKREALLWGSLASCGRLSIGPPAAQSARPRSTSRWLSTPTCTSSPGPAVVRALASTGANVNAADGVKHCTPLHMAARRGHVEIAKALLECGAYVNAKDMQGVTPLRRALNCRKQAVADLLNAWRGT